MNEASVLQTLSSQVLRQNLKKEKPLSTKKNGEGKKEREAKLPSTCSMGALSLSLFLCIYIYNPRSSHWKRSSIQQKQALYLLQKHFPLKTPPIKKTKGSFQANKQTPKQGGSIDPPSLWNEIKNININGHNKQKQQLFGAVDEREALALLELNGGCVCSCNAW